MSDKSDFEFAFQFVASNEIDQAGKDICDRRSMPCFTRHRSDELFRGAPDEFGRQPSQKRTLSEETR
jgi:hypothetical protein